MAKQTVNLGTLADGSDGDTNRVAWGKANSNFDELYDDAADAQLKGGLRNLLINAAGSINQRGYVSGTATTTANQYTIDRWKVKTSGQNVAWTTSGGISTFTAPAGGFAQIVEGASILGGSYTLSWTGTATATVAGSAVTNGTPFTLPANTNAEVVFSGGTVSKPQLELGEQTVFEKRPVCLELLLCQRYYEKSYELGVTPGTITTVGYINYYMPGLSGTISPTLPIPFKIVKRSSPAITFYSPNSGVTSKAYDYSANADIACGAIGSANTTGTNVHPSMSASGVINFGVHYTADAEL